MADIGLLWWVIHWLIMVGHYFFRHFLSGVAGFTFVTQLISSGVGGLLGSANGGQVQLGKGISAQWLANVMLWGACRYVPFTHSIPKWIHKWMIVDLNFYVHMIFCSLFLDVFGLAPYLHMYDKWGCIHTCTHMHTQMHLHCDHEGCLYICICIFTRADALNCLCLHACNVYMSRLFDAHQ